MPEDHSVQKFSPARRRQQEDEKHLCDMKLMHCFLLSTLHQICSAGEGMKMLSSVFLEGPSQNLTPA